MEIQLRGAAEAILARDAGEVLKLVTGHGRPFVDGFLTFSAFQGDFQFIPAPRRPDCSHCGR